MEPQNRYGPRDDYSTLPGPVDLFRETWPQYTKNLKKLIVIQLGPRILTFITVFLSTLGLLNLFNFLIRQLRLGESLFVLSFPFVFVFVLGVAIEAFLLAAMIHVIKQEDGGIGIIESYRRSWNNILSYWWVLALSAAIMVGGLFLFVIPAVIFIIWFSLGIFVAVKGEFLFAPSKKSKVILGIVCILGVVGVLLFIPLVFQIALAALLGPQS